MRRNASVLLLLPILATLPLTTPAASQDVQTVELREWTVPWPNSRPRDPYFDAASGFVWFVGQTGNYVAYFDPRTTEFKRYEIEDGTNPHSLIVDSRGVWYTGNQNGRIGRLDPQTGKLTIYMMPDSTARDPHTPIFDAKGDLWFTVQGGNFVGKLDTGSGKIVLAQPPFRGARPYGIVLDREGRVWFDLFGTNRIGTIDPATMKMTTMDLPNQRSRPRRIAITSDQRIWYTDYALGRLGRLDPKTGEVRDWPTPGGERSQPYAMAVDDRDRIWFVETGVRPNRFVGFDPRSEAFFSVTDIASGGGAVRQMMFDPKARVIWFGTDTNNIGRVVVP